jgi:6,7-dimethyl-8-ribityllumazine synthase
MEGDFKLIFCTHIRANHGSPSSQLLNHSTSQLNMASALKNLSEYDEKNMPSAAELHFGIVVADWNAKVTHALYKGCVDTLLQHGAKEENIHVVQVPGSFELPQAARLLLGAHKLDAVIALGCVIKGETSHNEYINNSVALGLTNLSIAASIPCIFGVLTPNDEQQAIDRAGGKYGNKGIEAGVTAIRMAALRKDLQKGGKAKIGF